MLVDARTVPDGSRIEADVCIVGAGAAGITMARELRRRPLRVVVLESGGRRQVLQESFRCFYVEEGTEGRKVMPSDEMPKVIWSGDMDGDGKIDLLLQMSDHYNMSRICLYLSSLAPAGQLVALAGEHITVGC